MTLYSALLYFYLYGFLGWCAEVAFAAARQRTFVNRGFLNGPICPIYGVGVITVVGLLEPFQDHLILLYLMSTLIVTAIEWAVGFLMEKIFHHKWWDYSDKPLNLNGYVCAQFSAIWGAACVVILYFVHPFFAKMLSFLPIWLAWMVDIVLTLMLAADVTVTVASVLKLNKSLDKMEEITAELSRMSEHVGNSIYENMMEGLEKQEQQRQRMEELRQKYQELLENNSVMRRRIINAFPGMTSQRHRQEFQRIKEQLKQAGKKPK